MSGGRLKTTCGLSLPLAALAMALAWICAFFPLREASACGVLRGAIADAERRASSLRAEIALLEAEAAQARTPEYLFWLARELGVELSRMEPAEIGGQEDGDGTV